MKRKQFTFYYSFLDVIECITEPREKLQAYDALTHYALLGEKPDMDSLGMGAKMVMKLAMPLLTAASRKAAGAMKRARYAEDTAKIVEGYPQDDPQKDKLKNQDQLKSKFKPQHQPNCGDGDEDFQRFWELYPKKIHKTRALEAFHQVQVPVQVLLEAVRKQSRSIQWNREDGRFIPQPDTWLTERRWEDELPEPVPKGASGELGEAELAAIHRMLEIRPICGT